MTSSDRRAPAVSSRILLMAAAFPPPVGGQSLVNEALLRRLSETMTVKVVNLSAGRLDRGLQYHARRLVRALTACCNVILERRGALYISTDSGYGLAYNILLASAGRVRGMRIVLHHHSFSFISQHSQLMKLLKMVAGPDATHVFLCECMETGYAKQYGVVRRPLISSNACHLALGRGHPRSLRPDGLITIGLLSHLSPEKGLDDFIELVRRCSLAGTPIRAILAGPPVANADQEKITRALESFPGVIEYRGPVFGEEKARFFRDIDVFIFPTRFRVEAQPVVLLESISQGCPLISYARGCIADDMSGGGGLVVPIDGDFALIAHTQLRGWIANAREYEVASLESLALFEEQLVDSRRKLNSLVALLGGEK